MKVYTHITVGASLGYLVAFYSHGGIAYPLLFAWIGGFFGALPDLDVVFSQFGVMEHRSVLSHSLLAAMIATGFMALILWTRPLDSNVVESFNILYNNKALTLLVTFIGVFSHANLDSLTHSGTHLFYPFTKKRYTGWIKYDNILANIAVTFTFFFGVLALTYFM